jgi:hypothetical protein
MSEVAVDISVRVICIHPPLGERDGQQTVFGLQDKKGGLEMGSRQDDDSLVYTADLIAKPGADGGVDFSGAVVQGTPGGRFLYLSLGYAGTLTPEWIKRIKVPLMGIRWEQVEAAHAQGKALETTVDGRGAATVKLLGDGWVVR